MSAASIGDKSVSPRVSRQAYIWNAGVCENIAQPPYCCRNGASNPDCCAKGSGRFCCLNGADNEKCLEELESSEVKNRELDAVL